MTDTELPYRPNVCMFVVNSERKIFLGERLGEPGVWQLPQGGAEPHLTLEENVYKELEEELGAPRDLFLIVQKFQATHTYDFRNPPQYAKGVWRGQAQTFWLVSFKGKDVDINLKKHVQEFESFQWVEPGEFLKVAEPVRIPGYTKPFEEVLVSLKNHHFLR